MKLKDFRQEIFKQKVNKRDLVGQLKFATSNEQEKIFKVFRNNPFLNAFIFKQAKPERLEDLVHVRQLGFTNSLIHEVNWLVSLIDVYQNDINQFLDLKEQYEYCFLISDYNRAHEILNLIEEKIGVSIWLLENRFLLSEFKDGVKENWLLLSEFSKSITNPYILFSIEYLSKRAEKNISYFRFRNLFSNMITDVGFDPTFREYLCFKFDYFSFTGYSNYATYFSIEGQFPIVDRYLTLVDVLIEMTVHNKGLDDNEYVGVINRLNFIINDVRLKQLNNLFTSEYSFFSPTSICIPYFDNYGKQDFFGCIEQFPTIVANNPLVVELYEVYIKSLLRVESKFVPLDEFDFINEILENLYNVYSRNEKNEESTENLLKITQSFSSTVWAKKLLGLIAGKINLSPQLNNFQNLSFLNSYINNPRLISVQENPLKTYDAFSKQFPDSIAVEIQAFICSLPIKDQIIEMAEVDIYRGRRLMKIKQFFEATSHYENILASKKMSICYYEEIITNLFKCYLEIPDYKKALKIFCSNYLQNKFLIASLDTDRLRAALETVDLSELGENIELPLFYNITNADFYSQYVAYDTFLNQQNVDKPTDLSNFPQEERSLYIYFLKNVCKSDVMHYSLWFESSDDIDNERINICRMLVYIDPINQEEYLEEIAEVTQQSSIRNAIREVNKGRITVNINQLKTSEASNIKESFGRFRELASFSRTKDLIAIDATSEILKKYLSNYDGDKEVFDKVVFTNDPAFITFKIMFLEIRDKFILSKEYGLDGYLSTRIRHGTLKNHIRSLFESLNLITQKDSNSDYVDNIYWSNKVSSESLNQKLQFDLKFFSKEIDDFADYIIKELIQVRTEKIQDKKNALFDYSFTQEQLGSFFKHIRDANFKDYNEFLDLITNVLVVRTDDNLKFIRQQFNSFIKQRFHNIISNLQNSIKLNGIDRILPDLLTSVLKSNTDIQQELQNISAWFNLAEQSSNLILNIETIIKTGIEITNSIYPNRKIHPEILDETDLYLSGAYCQQLIYITRILLDNIITHSGLESEDLKVKIKAAFDESNNNSSYTTTLNLSFSNNISKNVKINVLTMKLEKIKEKFNSSALKFENINFEGGSGFDKIKKILSIDLGGRKSSIDFYLTEQLIEVRLSLEVTIKTVSDD